MASLRALVCLCFLSGLGNGLGLGMEMSSAPAVAGHPCCPAPDPGAPGTRSCCLYLPGAVQAHGAAAPVQSAAPALLPSVPAPRGTRLAAAPFAPSAVLLRSARAARLRSGRAPPAA